MKLTGSPTMSPDAMVTLPQCGGCVCASVRYGLSAAPLLAFACHCHDCQKRSGSAFSFPLIVRTADLTVTGEVEIERLATRSGREIDHTLCPRCRCRVMSRAVATPEYLSLRAGTLDDASWVVPIVQTWVESAIPWAVIPGVRIVAWKDFDHAALGREWRAMAPQFG
ncbi:MAG: GFA family protein [Proteobacteria bacterium]|nr:GFA family protein [Pseudomonadota bacterium]